jgi:hypothetical protein
MALNLRSYLTKTSISSVIDTAGATSSVSMTPLRRYDAASARDLEFGRLWLPLKEISILKNYICKLYYPVVLYTLTITQKIYGLYKDHFWLQQCH